MRATFRSGDLEADRARAQPGRGVSLFFSEAKRPKCRHPLFEVGTCGGVLAERQVDLGEVSATPCGRLLRGALGQERRQGPLQMRDRLAVPAEPHRAWPALRRK